MPLTVTLGDTAYRANPDDQTITPDTPVAALVGDLLETGEPIGPQTDEYAGVTGTWDEYPKSVIAAFLDIARKLGRKLGPVVPDDPPAEPVTAGFGDGGFDALGNWHDPGSGEFARPGMSTAKALTESLFRALIHEAQSIDGTEALLNRGIPGVGERGDRVHVGFHSPDLADVTGRDGRRVRVPWGRLSHPDTPAYANLGTGEGRETPMPVDTNDMVGRPRGVTADVIREALRALRDDLNVEVEKYEDGHQTAWSPNAYEKHGKTSHDSVTRWRARATVNGRPFLDRNEYGKNEGWTVDAKKTRKSAVESIYAEFDGTYLNHPNPGTLDPYDDYYNNDDWREMFKPYVDAVLARRSAPSDTNDMREWIRNGRAYQAHTPNRGSGYVPPPDTLPGIVHSAGADGMVLAFNEKASPRLVAEFGPTPRVRWVDSKWGEIIGGPPGESYVYWHNFDLPGADTNDMAARPATTAQALWYEATVDGVTYSPHHRTAEPPSYMLLARRTDDGPWEPIGFSTADNEADALADADLAAPSAVAVKAVSDLTARHEPPPTTVRSVPTPRLAVWDEDAWRNHEQVFVNDRYAGVIRQEDRGIGDTTGPWQAFGQNPNEPLGLFDARQDAVDAVAADAETRIARRATDTGQNVTRPAVSVSAVADIRAKVDKLNARAERKGLTGRVEMTVGESYSMVDPSWDTDLLGTVDAPRIEVVDVTLTATPIALDGGWEYAGVVDYKTMRDAMQGWNADTAADAGEDFNPADMVLLHSAAGYTLPDRFRTDAVCDDCGRAMPRNKLIVAADADGNLTRLGTTCVKDVLGHDPAKLLWFSEAFRDLADDEETWDRPAPEVWDPVAYVTAAILAVNKYGYTKVSENDSTKSLIMGLSKPPRKGDSERLVEFREIVAAHYDAVRNGTPDTLATEARAVIDYIRSDDFRARNEFGHNMKSAFAGKFITARLAGIAAYGPSLYRRDHETDDVKTPAAEVPNEWIGEVDDKVELTGTVRKITKSTNDWGTSYGLTIDTDQGVVHIWAKAGSDIADAAEEGAAIRFKGKVKSHNEYPKGSGQRQTEVFYAAVVQTRADRLRDKIESDAVKLERSREDVRAKVMWAATVSTSYADGEATNASQARADRYPLIPDSKLAEFTKRLEALPRRLPNERPYPDRRNSAIPYYDLEPGRQYGTPPDGTVLAHPRVDTPIGDAGFAPGPDWLAHDKLIYVGGNLIDPDTGNVAFTADDILALSAAVKAHENIYPSSERYKTPAPAKPTWIIQSRPDEDTPWADHGPLTVTAMVALRDGTSTTGEFTIDRDGSVDTHGLDIEPRSYAEVYNRAFIEANRAADNDWRTARLAEIDALLDEYATGADDTPADGDTLTPEWIEAGPWPKDFEMGAKVKKTYRIEPGGDVYLDGKRVTDRTGDKVLLAALAHYKVDPPPPAPTPIPDAPGVDINDMVGPPPAPSPVGSAVLAQAADSFHPGPDARVAHAAVTRVWTGDVGNVGQTRGLQWAAADTFDRPPVSLPDATRDDDLALLAQAGVDDPDRTLAALQADAAVHLILAGVDPADTVTLYRPITVAQAEAWDAAGRPDSFASTPLASYFARFSDAAGAADGGVFTVDLPASNIVTFGLRTPGEVVAVPLADGTVPATRFRSAKLDAAAAAAGRAVGVPLGETNDMIDRDWVVAHAPERVADRDAMREVASRAQAAGDLAPGYSDARWVDTLDMSRVLALHAKLDADADAAEAARPPMRTTSVARPVLPQRRDASKLEDLIDAWHEAKDAAEAWAGIDGSVDRDAKVEAREEFRVAMETLAEKARSAASVVLGTGERVPVADMNVGDVFTLRTGMKIERTASGFVDQATGRPVDASGEFLD